MRTPNAVREYMVSISDRVITDQDLCWFNCWLISSTISRVDLAEIFRDGVESKFCLDSLQQTLLSLYDGGSDLEVDNQIKRYVAMFLNNRDVLSNFETTNWE